MRILGEELKETSVVLVNGKRIVAPILELDAEAGWVRIAVPPSIEVTEASRVQADGYTDLEPIDLVEKVLTGKVEIA